jgi:histidinol-phosphate aminotransferase
MTIPREVPGSRLPGPASEGVPVGRPPGPASRGVPGGRPPGLAGWLPVRPDLAGQTAYGAPQLDVPVQLNTNENPYPPSPGLVRAITDAVADVAGTLNRYPDRDAVALREALAGYLGHGLTAGQVWAANGSNEIIQQLLQAFGGPGAVALGFEPSYSMHPLIALATCTPWVQGARDSDFGLDPDRAVAVIRAERPAVTFLTSPNNPTGAALPIEVIDAVCEAAPGMVVVDEAYAEFARDGTPSALTLLPKHPRLVVTRTMSKAFALAGARVGYLAADPEVLRVLLLVRLPYHLSAVTQAVARAALAHQDEPLATVAAIRAERDDLVSWLRSRRLAVADSDANFVLFGEFADRHAIWQALLDRGVLIRETGPAAWLRVSVGTPAEMAAFRGAMDATLDEAPGTGPGRAGPPAGALGPTGKGACR